MSKLGPPQLSPGAGASRAAHGAELPDASSGERRSAPTWAKRSTRARGDGTWVGGHHSLIRKRSCLRNREAFTPLVGAESRIRRAPQSSKGSTQTALVA